MSQTAGPPRGGRQLPLALMGLGLVLTGLLFGPPALTASYVHDDHPAVIDNANVRWPPNIAQIFTTPWFGPARGFATQGLSRPLVTLGYAVEAGLDLGSPGRHAVNLLLYALICGLVGLLVASLLRGQPPQLIRVSATLATLLFAAHPLHASSVLCVAYRPELQAAALALAATLAFIACARGQKWAGPASLMLMLVALWSKESALTVLAPWTVWLWSQRDGDRRTAATWLAATAVVCLLWLAWRATWLGTPFIAAHDNPLAHVGVGERLLGALWLVAYAAKKLLWPYDLAPDETFDSLPVLHPAGWLVLTGGVIVLSLVALAVRDLLRVRSAHSTGTPAATIAWFGGAWLPVSNLLFASTVVFADRLLFLPSIAMVGMIAALLGRAWCAGGIAQRAALGLALGLLVPWASASAAEGEHWQSEAQLFAHGAAVRPNNLRMRYNLGRLRLGAKDNQGAATHLTAAHTIDPQAPAPWTLLVQAETRLGHCDVLDPLIQKAGTLRRQDDPTRKAAIDADVMCRRYGRAFVTGQQLKRVDLTWGRKVYVAGVAAADPAAKSWAARFTKSPDTNPSWVAAAVFAEQQARRPAGALRRLRVLSEARPTMRAPIEGALRMCQRAKPGSKLQIACKRWPGTPLQ
ncbi:MAG: hypothetical protein KC502_00920 [Myxococcales bacterium]|nr:hypothetical protein [Myxococcales bacterium]